MKELGLYIHFPFCVSKCHYCNFVSYEGMDDFKESYIKAMLKEIVAFSSNANEHTITSIYIGGGTPSCLDNGVVSKVLKEVFNHYNIAKKVEISIEANPNSITYEKAKEWKSAGINRVSIGLQSSQDNLLKVINRPHTKQDYLNAIKILKKVGFTNINTDMMLGLPGQTLKDVKETLKLILKTKIPHVSAYSLILEEGTKLYELVGSGELTLPDEDVVIKMYDYVKKTLENHKIYRYEVSNFAKRKHECLHNNNCWNLVDYVGFGVGANSCFNQVRWGNIANVKHYIDNIKSNISIKEYEDKLTNEDLFDEYVMLKLRTRDGIDLRLIKNEFYIDLINLKKQEIKNLKKYGLIELKNNHLIATEKGFKVLNQIIIDLVY